MAAVKDFSVEERLVSVLRVQKFDSKIDEINKLRGELPMEVKDLEDDLEGLKTRENTIKNDIFTREEFIASKKEAQKVSSDLLKKYEKQQSNVKNSREFEAINKEIEMQDLEIKAAEKKIKDAQFEIKDLQRSLEDAQERLKAKEDVLAMKQKELLKIVEETEKEEKEIQKKSDDAKANVEGNLLNAYSRIRSNYKNGLAVVAVERNSCGGCFNVIPAQLQAEIRLRKKIIACEHCGRILVDDELNERIGV